VPSAATGVASVIREGGAAPTQKESLNEVVSTPPLWSMPTARYSLMTSELGRAKISSCVWSGLRLKDCSSVWSTAPAGVDVHQAWRDPAPPGVEEGHVCPQVAAAGQPRDASIRDHQRPVGDDAVGQEDPPVDQRQVRRASIRMLLCAHFACLMLSKSHPCVAQTPRTWSSQVGSSVGRAPGNASTQT
jgi:hypothetical protein